MNLEGPSRWIALGLGALIVVGAAVAFALGHDSSPEVSEISVEMKPPRAERDEPNSSEREAGVSDHEEAPDGSGREMELSGRGTPIVWVRDGRAVKLHGAPGGPVVETLGERTEYGSQTILAVFERRGDWAGVPNPYTGNDTLGWVKLDSRNLKAGYTLREITVDLSERRAKLAIDGKVVRRFTVSIGAPGTTTPTGRFAVTDTFRGDLNPAYGCCAVALTAEQPNLPSGWLGGSRIAIHGTGGPLGEAISSGCVRAADRDVNALVNEVPPGAPVLVRQ